MQKIFFSICIALAALWVGCRKNVDDTTILNGPIPSVMVEATIMGRVTYQGEAVSLAQIMIGNKVYSTNDQGIFLIKNEQLDQNGTLLKAIKNGFFTAYRFVYPQLGSITQVNIELKKKDQGIVFQSTQGTALEISYNNGQPAGLIIIPPNAIAYDNGAGYNGSVRAYMVAFDPTKPEDLSTAPGDLRAQDSTAQARYLQSFGMLGVELIDQAGNRLNLRPGTKAKMQVWIPESLLGIAPNEIPLWHFNENNGYWEEEGKATRNGDVYEGEVGHFSFWNCDIPTDYCHIKGRVVNGNGDPIVGATVFIGSPNYGVASGLTDQTGTYAGIIPANEVLEVRVGDCNVSTNFGPFAPASQNQVANIVLQNNLFTFSGKVVDCSGNPVANAVAFIDQYFALTNSSGQYQFITQACSTLVGTSVVAQAFDLGAITTSLPILVTIGGTTVAIPDLEVCNALDEYIIVNVEGATTIYNADLKYISAGVDSSYISGNITGLQYNFYVEISEDGALNSTIGNTGFSYTKSTGELSYGYCKYCATCDCGVPLPITFTSYPTNVGDYAMGSYSGNVKDEFTSLFVPYTVSFRIKRTQ